MRMTPLEIQNHQFSRRLSGLDPEEVVCFLKIVADDYESALRENERLKDSVHQLEKRNDELADGEKVLRETLVSAQAMAEKLRETAVAESEVLLNTAEVRAEKILDASHRRAATLAEEIRELRGLRQRYATSLRSMIDTHLGLIDRLEQDEEEPIPHLTGIMRKYRTVEADEPARVASAEAQDDAADADAPAQAEFASPDDDGPVATVMAVPKTDSAPAPAGEEPKTSTPRRRAAQPIAAPPPA
ncbi:MAG: DivIVA domain-containing protein [Myxococcota bacterium]|jgi:cell division initiation protein|nr:DivIVA domain-containing protein [Myxococcota bacterium]